MLYYKCNMKMVLCNIMLHTKPSLQSNNEIEPNQFVRRSNSIFL